jgi:hypothetical protein
MQGMRIATSHFRGRGKRSKTSLSVSNIPPILPTPFYLNLPTYPAEQTAQPASGTHVTTAYPAHARGSPLYV